MSNPEQSVIDAIDELVDWQMSDSPAKRVESEYYSDFFDIADHPVRVTGRPIRTSDARWAIRDRADFRTHGALRGATTNRGSIWTTGRLPAEHRERFNSDLAGNGGYVVWSYETPIAWWSEIGGWFIPAVKYSVTTSTHQAQLSLVRD